MALAKAVGYAQRRHRRVHRRPATRNFYFLEMNTRLQVEHPVTELVTGLDLVEQMIRVAAGEKLALHAEGREARTAGRSRAGSMPRIPYRNFLPSIGRLMRYRAADGRPRRTCAIDTGVDEGGEISIFYDPMIAKLITYGADRDARRSTR